MCDLEELDPQLEVAHRFLSEGEDMRFASRAPRLQRLLDPFQEMASQWDRV